jgi:hypothetical protein
MDLSNLAVIELKRLLYKHRAEIIEDLQLESPISCPECVIGNCDSGCYKYCCGCCNCNHNDCDDCDMTCHSDPKLDNKCRCNCDHSNCDTEENDEPCDHRSNLRCDGVCHEACKYLQYIDGNKKVVAMLLKRALSINDKIFNKYNDLLNLD